MGIAPANNRALRPNSVGLVNCRNLFIRPINTLLVFRANAKAGTRPALVLVDAQTKHLAAHVDHVAGALDPINRSRQVDISLLNSDGKLLPGAYAEISINVTGQNNPLLVPANVLVVDQAGTHVAVVDGESRIGFRPVKLGRDFGREVEILEGVTANDVLVASPSDLLVERETVTAVEPQQKQATKEKSSAKS